MNESFQTALEFVERDGRNDIVFEMKSKSRLDRLKERIGVAKKNDKENHIRGDIKNHDIKDPFST